MTILVNGLFVASFVQNNSYLYIYIFFTNIKKISNHDLYPPGFYFIEPVYTTDVLTQVLTHGALLQKVTQEASR